MPFQDALPFMNGYAGRLIDHQHLGVFVEHRKLWLRLGWRSAAADGFLKWNIQPDAITGANQVLGFGMSTVDPQTVLPKKFADVADWKPALQETLQLFIAFSRRHDDFLIHHGQSATRFSVRQAKIWAIFAIL